MQRQLRRRLLEHLQRVRLLLAQGRDHGVWARVVACEGGEVVGVDFVPDSQGIIDTSVSVVVATLGVQHAGDVPRVLTGAYFSFAVKVPVGRCEGFDHVWVRALQGVVDVVGRGDVGFAAREGFADAEEAD
jgi:hypothetical protein